MKRRYLLFTSIALILASCSTSDNNNNNNLKQEAQIDSTTRSNLVKQDILNQKKNDSIINAIAMAKADSIAKAEGIAKPKEKPDTKKPDPKDQPNNSNQK